MSDVLLARASKIALNVEVNRREGYFEVTWRRPVTERLSIVMSHEADTREEALTHLILMEERYWRRGEHPLTCGCEDCCIERVDLSRAQR